METRVQLARETKSSRPTRSIFRLAHPRFHSFIYSSISSSLETCSKSDDRFVCRSNRELLPKQRVSQNGETLTRIERREEDQEAGERKRRLYIRTGIDLRKWDQTNAEFFRKYPSRLLLFVTTSIGNMERVIE